MVSAYFINHVPGRKTAMLDSEWLAVLGRFGLLRGSFIPPKGLRELRLVSRYRRKLGAICSSQPNRLHKMLDDTGIKLGAVVSDIHGVPRACDGAWPHQGADPGRAAVAPPRGS